MTEIARLLLAAVLAVAGAAKLTNRDGTRQSVRDFGLPERLTWPLAVGLPVFELGLAAGLLPTATTRPSAAAAALLLLSFTALVAASLVKGSRPECSCFGRLGSAPVGWGTVARNLGLAALALVVASHAATTIGVRDLAVFAVAALAAGQALLWLVLLRRYGSALRRLAALESDQDEATTPILGTAAPRLTLPTVDGDMVSLQDLLEDGRPLLLVFTDTGCGACTALYPMLGAWQDTHRSRLTIAVVGHGDPELLRAAAEEHVIDTLLVAPDRDVVQALGVIGVPSAVLVDADGRVASPVLFGADEIGLLFDPADTPAAVLA